ncbi:MAG TPA: glycerophosphodiester phosphodiesterase [Myxococcota bacterium]|jgi:glycerophosphoryl diester phosphodiesterase|nr:glycerophosphodiester phosphodiesterase [Myxococcota bacterium]
MRHPYFDLPTPIVIGHRGAAGERPENTLPSFARARDLGAAILETDAHPTRDGAVVLFHDETLERTTDGTGRISDHTLAELRALDAGFRFTPDEGGSFPFRGHGVRIPTLEEALSAMPDARLNIELKQHAPGFLERVIGILRDAGREETTLLTAGEDPIMAALRETGRRVRARVALGASAGDVLRFVRAALDAAKPDPEVMALQIPAEFAGQPLVTPRLVAHARSHGVHVHVWTINAVEEMDRLLDLGVHGLVTDYPATLASVIARRAGR